MADDDSSYESGDECYDDFELRCEIIEEIKEHPLLYDKKHPEHFRRDKKLNILRKIADKIGISGNLIFIYKIAKIKQHSTKVIALDNR